MAWERKSTQVSSLGMAWVLRDARFQLAEEAVGVAAKRDPEKRKKELEAVDISSST